MHFLCKSLDLDLIPLFLQSLEFDLIVYSPYRSIDGFVNDMEVSLINPFVMLIYCFGDSYISKKFVLMIVQESSFVGLCVCLIKL